MSRRRARDTIFKILFQVDVGKNLPEEALAYHQAGEGVPPDEVKFIREVVLGCLENQGKLDESIQAHLKGWKVDRVSAVDRNLLRMAAYELGHREDIPPLATINEAIELAKKYGSGDSAKFINGILDRLLKNESPV